MRLNEVTLDNIEFWPPIIKAAAIIMIAVFVLGISYWLDISKQLTQLSRARQQENELRDIFADKQQYLANIDTYRQQVAEITKMLAKMVHQFPSETEIPGLLEDISEVGVESGLKFLLFDPLQEEQYEYYAELSIRISVLGNYHQLATFVSRIAQLERIVTIHDFEIIPAQRTDTATQDQSLAYQSNDNKELIMNMTAKIYRYTLNTDGMGEQL